MAAATPSRRNSIRSAPPSIRPASPWAPIPGSSIRIRPRRLAFHHRTRHRYRHGCRHHPAAAPDVRPRAPAPASPPPASPPPPAHPRPLAAAPATQFAELHDHGFQPRSRRPVEGPEHHAHLEFAEDRHHATRVGTQDQCELDQSLAGLWQQQHHHDGTRSGPRHRQYGQPRRGHQFRARLYFRIRPRRLAFHHRTRHRYRHGCRHHPAAAPGVPHRLRLEESHHLRLHRPLPPK